jgi:virulence factor Mce-like protein
MAAFTLSCFGLLLFLWSAFGGPVPLKPRGYTLKVSFGEATQLAQEADVRISGVPVGKVKKIELGDDGRTEATLELNDKYAPARSDARAILRQKTLLGETYVEMTPGTRGAPALPEDAHLPTKQVAPTVELDEIFRAFDAKTRKAFQVWQQSVAQGIQNHGQDFSDALGSLTPFAEDTNKVLETLNSQSRATKLLIRNTGEVFRALSERDGQLAQLISNSNRVFGTTAKRDEEIKQTFIALPTFIDESKKTLRRLESYAANTNPLITQLHPWAREASRTLESFKKTAPDFNHFMQNLGPLVTTSRRGLPAGSQFLDDLRPLLGQLDPFLRNLNPFLRYIGLYNREFAAMFANVTAATNYNDRPGTDVRTVRLSIPGNPEALGTFPRRMGPNRANAYTLPGMAGNILQGLDSFDTRNCANGGYPALAPASASLPADLRNRVLEFFFANSTTGVTPACKKQGKFTFGGVTTDFPQVREDPSPATP